MRSLPVVLAVLLLSGCSAPSDSGAAEPTDAGPAVVGSFLALEDCVGLHLDRLYAPGMNPARPPAGWTVDEQDYSAITLYAWRCAHVGLDELERPATVAWEVANNGAAPAACTYGAGFRPSYLVNVFTDEPALAERLEQAYGMDVHRFTFDMRATDAGASFAWTVDGSETTIALGSEGSRFHDVTRMHRFVWSTPSGSGFMDFNQTHSVDPLFYRPAYGTVGEPHQFGTAGRFAGTGTFTQDGTFLGAIKLRGEACA